MNMLFWSEKMCTQNTYLNIIKCGYSIIIHNYMYIKNIMDMQYALHINIKQNIWVHNKRK